ncbi:MAG: carbon-nitrogen hydrolase family protein [Eubacteriales bacterium]|nr:carbon-nitrogen hydrolase family protein [Eubacteriales bacterium]
MKNFKLAVIQLDSQEDKKLNLEKTEAFIREARANGADMVALPEVFNVIDKSKTPAENIPDGESTQLLIKLAKELGLYIHGGSIGEENPDGDKRYNTTVFIDPNGEILAKYRKLHLFDIDMPDGTKKRESDRIAPGQEIVSVETDLANIGLTICYDLRFPELFRTLALNGAELIFVPANFTMPTGKDHWEALLRARAIENTVYIAAPGQIGTKTGNNPSFGSSMIIDPWGTVIARASEREEVIYADIDAAYLQRVRQLIPCLQNRRSDVYSLEEVK